MLPIAADQPPLRQMSDGVVRVAGTRIPLERVVRAFLSGATPEQIAQDYDSLSLEDVYAVVNFFLHHRDEVTDYMATVDRHQSRVRDEIECEFDPTGVRERLLARQRTQAG